MWVHTSKGKVVSHPVWCTSWGHQDPWLPFTCQEQTSQSSHICWVWLLVQLSQLCFCSALPTVIAPSHTAPQPCQSQTVTSPVALNESDSPARSQDPPSVHPPQSSPPLSTCSSSAPVSHQWLSNDIHLCYLYSRSLVNKLSNFQSFVYSHAFDVICITVSGFIYIIMTKRFSQISSHISKDGESHGGGVLIYSSKQSPSKLLYPFTSQPESSIY